MSLFRKSDYDSRIKSSTRKDQRVTSVKVKFPTNLQTKKRLIKCPRGCTQHRTKSHRLQERKTFDSVNNICFNCGFKKLPETAKFYGAGFKKASRL
ncbi:hypothetical protein LCGC14_0372550 [marine sediment metagenome]|uniref:Uncharacterized protein n=1 Tax=marine sediment metagenome TaxID=412755 RepID=A0A0F9TAL5_9ZZZZ